jgi:hypothetical protein
VRIWLGNSHAADKISVPEGTANKDGTLTITGSRLRKVPLPGKRITKIVIPDSYSVLEALQVVVAADGVWNNHTEGDNVTDHAPDWVESDNEGMAQLLALEFGCPVGRPKSWKAVQGGDPDAG